MDQPGESSASSTRSFDTSPRLTNVRGAIRRDSSPTKALLEDVLRGDFAGKPVNEELVKDFHSAFLAPMLPTMAGMWRVISVQVGNHVPPQRWEIPLRIRIDMPR